MKKELRAFTVDASRRFIGLGCDKLLYIKDAARKDKRTLAEVKKLTDAINAFAVYADSIPEEKNA